MFGLSIVSERIKEIRETNNLTQAEIANKLGISVSGYRKIEYGERDPNIDLIRDLSNMFNISSDYILGLTNLENSLYEKKFEVMLAANNLKIAELQYLKVKDREGADSIETVNAYGNLLQIKGHYNKSFYEYMIDFFDQPSPNPYEDLILKDKFPIKYEIKPDSISGFGVVIHATCADGYDLGRIKTFSGGVGLDEEIATEKATKYIEEMLNYFRIKQ